MKKPEKLVLHENSPSHRKSFTMWKEAERTQQFDRPHAGDCKIRIQSRIRADNKTCAYGYRDHNKFENSPSNSVREFSIFN